jgi:hypothetical protein
LLLAHNDRDTVWLAQIEKQGQSITKESVKVKKRKGWEKNSKKKNWNTKNNLTIVNHSPTYDVKQCKKRVRSQCTFSGHNKN